MFLFLESPSPDSSGNPFYFFFKNKKIVADSGISSKKIF
ncbi:hypothetical protein FEM08_04540 [Flavobacterium gilvum]|nr:hypothetical protein FEM08_04540 [Flavobacterium gilvum]